MRGDFATQAATELCVCLQKDRSAVAGELGGKSMDGKPRKDVPAIRPDI